MPRYFAGRRLLVKASVHPNFGSKDYMTYKRGATEYVTHRATLLEGDLRTGNLLVDVDGKLDGPLNVSLDETMLLNQPHIFMHDAKGDIVFEDSVYFAAKGKIEKAKLIEMARALASIVEILDFNSPDCLEK